MTDFTVEGIITIDASRGIRNLTRFQTKLKSVVNDIRKTSREIDRLDGRQIKINVEVSKKEIDELKADLKTVKDETVKIKTEAVNVKETRTEMLDLEAELHAMADQDIRIKVEMEGTKDLIAQAEAINAEVDALLDEKKKIKVDFSELSAAKASVLSLASSIQGPGFSLVSAIAAVAPALIPMAAVITGVMGGMISSFTVAGLGVAAFGALAFPTLKEVASGVKMLNTDVSKLSPDKLKELQKSLADLKKTNPLVYKASQALIELKNSYMKMAEKIKPDVLQQVNIALDTGQYLLKQMARTAKPVASAITVLFMKMDAGLKSKEWRKFFNYIHKNAGSFVLIWGMAVGNFITGIANMIRAFDPLTKWFNTGLLGMSRDFRKWSNGLDKDKGFQNFVKYVKENGPKVGHFIGLLIGDLIGIGKALAPLGTDVLDFINKILGLYDAFKKAHPQIADLAAKVALLALVLSPVLQMLGPMLPEVIGLLGPIGGLAVVVGAAAFAIAYFGKKGKDHAKMMDSLKQVWTDLKDDARFLWQEVKKLWDIFQKSGATEQLQQAFTNIFDSIHNLMPLFKPMAILFGGMVLSSLIAFAYGVNQASKAIKFFTGIVGWVVKKVVNFFKWMYDVLIGHSIIPDLINGIKRWFGKMVGFVMRPVRAVGRFITRTWSNIKSRVTGIVNGIKSNVSRAFSNINKTVRSLVSNAVSTVKGKFADMKSAVRDKLSDLVQGAREKFGNLVDVARTIVGRVKDAVVNSFNGANTWLLSAGASIISGLISGIGSKMGDLGGVLSGVGGFIKSHKGPPSYDRVMLKPAGKLIMKGLIKGIHVQRKSLGKELRGVTKQIRGTGGKMGSTLSGLGAGSGMGGGRGGKRVYQIKVEVPLGITNLAEVGKTVVAAIDAYEQAGG